MAIWTTFHVETSEFHLLKEMIIQLFQDEKVSIIDQAKNPNITKHRTFSKNTPNFVAMGQWQPNWIAIRYNNNCKLETWSQAISLQFNGHVIVLMAESVSSYYYLSIYKEGQKVREIEVCYSDMDFKEINEGEKFNIEAEIFLDDKILNFESFVKYTHFFGLEIEFDYNRVNWTIIEKKTEEKTTLQVVRELNNKLRPWWKFWTWFL